jgi:hypothetical protein
MEIINGTVIGIEVHTKMGFNKRPIYSSKIETENGILYLDGFELKEGQVISIAVMDNV